MSPTEFADAMRRYAHAAKHGDREIAHWDADVLMCKLLISLGYSEGVTIFEDMPKWHA
jgi:hypothetical protein